MTVTITLPDDLASRLRSRAAAERLSVEEFAAQALADIVEDRAETELWAAQNKRRLDLIRKRFHVAADGRRRRGTPAVAGTG